MLLNKNFFYILIAVVYTFFISQIDWAQLHGRSFVDREVSIEVLSSPNKPMDLTLSVDSIIYNVFNEQLWNQGVRWLNVEHNIKVESILDFITIFSIFVFSLFILKNSRFLYLFFLVNPLFIDLAFSQFRYCLTLSLLLLAHMSNKRFKLISLLFILPVFFIHTSSLLLLGLYFFIRYILRKENKKVDFFNKNNIIKKIALFTLAVSFILGPFRKIILTFFNDRRADYETVATSFTFATFWLISLIIFLRQKKDFIKNDINILSITFLLIFLFNSILGIYGLRFLTTAIPFFIISIYSLKGSTRSFFVILYMLNSFIQWQYWMSN